MNGKTTDSDKFRIGNLIVIFSFDISFVPFIQARLRVSAFPSTFILFLKLLSTKESMDPLWQKSIVSTEVFALKRVMGTICKLPLHQFAVSTASALLAVSLLPLVSFRGFDWFSSLWKNLVRIMQHQSLPQVQLASNRAISCPKRERKNPDYISWQPHGVLTTSFPRIQPFANFRVLHFSWGI